VIEKPRGRGEL
jgi:DNA-binding transcriptional ArsR family regulator